MSQEKDPKSKQTQGRFIILRKLKYSEADLILHALSPQGEKVSFIARGALRSKKRFGGGILEPTHFVNLSYKEAANPGQLNVLSEAAIINDFSALRKDYDRLELALYFVECVAKVSQEGDQDSESLFNLMGNSLKAAELSEDVRVLKMHFHLKFLLQQGVITPETWMSPFLKTNLRDSNTLLGLKEVVNTYFSTIEIMVKQYIQDATL